MNENRIQQVLEIERRAQEIHELAIREAQQLPISAEQESQALLEKARVGAQEEARPISAEQESQALLEKARVGAQEEARQLVANAQAKEETARILLEAGKKNSETEALAMSNFDRAVNYILDRVIGKE